MNTECKTKPIQTLENLKAAVDDLLYVASLHKAHPGTVYVNDLVLTMVQMPLTDGTKVLNINAEASK